MGNVKCTNVGSLLLNHISDTTQLTVVERNQPVKKMIEKMKSCELPNMKFNRTSVDLDFKYYYPSVEYLLDYMDKKLYICIYNKERCQDLKEFIQGEADRSSSVSCSDVGSVLLKAPSTDEPTYQYMYLMKKW